MKSVTTVNMVTVALLGMVVLIAAGLFFNAPGAVLAEGPNPGGSTGKHGMVETDIETRIASAVESGKLTQAEADVKLEQLTNGDFSKLRAGKRGMVKAGIETRIASAVESGKLTQAEADVKLDQLANGDFRKLRAGKTHTR